MYTIEPARNDNGDDGYNVLKNDVFVIWFSEYYQALQYVRDFDPNEI